MNFYKRIPQSVMNTNSSALYSFDSCYKFYQQYNLCSFSRVSARNECEVKMLLLWHLLNWFFRSERKRVDSSSGDSLNPSQRGRPSSWNSNKRISSIFDVVTLLPLIVKLLTFRASLFALNEGRLVQNYTSGKCHQIIRGLNIGNCSARERSCWNRYPSLFCVRSQVTIELIDTLSCLQTSFNSPLKTAGIVVEGRRMRIHNDSHISCIRCLSIHKIFLKHVFNLYWMFRFSQNERILILQIRLQTPPFDS